jgi:uncharacterized cupin superfamily protein
LTEEYADNVWVDLPELWPGVHGRRLVRTAGRPLAGAVWELPADSQGNDYHYHHGTEEYLVVLRGTPTLRTPEGERVLEEGAVVHFPPGPDGAHAILNRTDAPVRYVMIGAHASPDLVEYPDKGEFAAGSTMPSQRGQERFFVRLPLPNEAQEP